MEIPSSVFVAVYSYRHSKMRVVGTSLQPSLQVRQIREKITENKKRFEKKSPQRNVADFCHCCFVIAVSKSISAV